MAHTEFHTDVSPAGKYFQLTFITSEKTYFLAMQELARKCVDGDFPEAILNADLDGMALRIAKERDDEENVAYYKAKLNSIFGIHNFEPHTKMMFSTDDLPKCNNTEDD